MKQRKTSKLIILALSLALLIGSAVGIAVSANEATAPTILSKNVAADGNFCLMFAVDPATCEGSDVTLTVYNTNPEGLEGDALTNATVQTITKLVTDTQPEDLDGNPETAKTDVLVFTTKGVAAKDIADEWYITVESGDLSTTEKYSVREYAFERLYKDQTILAAGGTYEYRQKQFYLSILAVGSTAQDLLVNAELEAGATPERLANEYIYASIYNGNFSNISTDHAFVEKDEELTLTVNDGADVSAWQVITFSANGTEVSKTSCTLGTTIKVTGNTVVIPDPDFGTTVGSYFDHLGNPLLSFDNGSSGVIGAECAITFFRSSANVNDIPNTKYGFHEFKSDPDFGTVLSLQKQADDACQPAFYFSTDDYANGNANCVVFEADIKVVKASATFTSTEVTNGEALTSALLFTWQNATTSALHTFSVDSADRMMQDGLNMIDAETNLDNLVGGSALRGQYASDNSLDIAIGEWVNICYEFYTDAKTAVLYIDGEVAATRTWTSDVNIKNINSMGMAIMWRITDAEIQINDVFSGKIAKEYKAN